MWGVKILTTLPEFYTSIFRESLYDRGIKNHLWQYEIADITCQILNMNIT